MTSAIDDNVGRTTKVFLSYSRSEAQLAEYINERLRHNGLDPWLDFMDLEPGRSWDIQLAKAIAEADAVALILSHRSTESDNVSDEWRMALGRDKRIILLIFEAEPIPDDLRHCEWVDFRRNFARATDNLAALLERPYEEPSRPAPTKGFRAPLRVWLAFLLSLGVAVTSLVALWAVFIPAALLPLPGRILKRSFSYGAARNALLVMPWALVFTNAVLDPVTFEEGLESGWDGIVGLGFFFSIALWLLIRSGSFRVWVKPAAARPHSVRVDVEPYLNRKPPPTTFALDAAPQDEPYAQRVALALRQNGHQPSKHGEADVELRFVSTFHDTVEIDSSVITLPVLLADPDDELPPQLQRTQWIDMRRGFDDRLLNALGLLLDKPAELMGAIGVPPPHDQRVLPRRIDILIQTLRVGLAAILGSGVLAVVSLRGDLGTLLTSEAFAWYLVAAPLLAWAVVRTIRGFERRSPRRLRSTVVFALAWAFLVLTFVVGDISELLPTTSANETLGGAIMFAPLAVAFLLFVIWIGSIKQLQDWMPSPNLQLDERAGTTAKLV